MVHLLTGSKKFFELLKPNLYLSDQEYCNDISFHVFLESKPS